MPGDIRVERDGFSFYFPVVACLLLSAPASLVVWLMRGLRGWAMPRRERAAVAKNYSPVAAHQCREGGFVAIRDEAGQEFLVR